MQQETLNDISRFIREAQTVYFNPKTNCICIIRTIDGGPSILSQTLSYTNCTREDIESALEGSGMSYFNHEGRNGIIVFDIKDPPSAGAEENISGMTPREILTSLPWFMVIVDKKSNQATFYYSESSKPFSTASQMTVTCSLESLKQTIEECGQRFTEENVSLSRNLVTLHKMELPQNSG